MQLPVALFDDTEGLLVFRLDDRRGSVCGSRLLHNLPGSFGSLSWPVGMQDVLFRVFFNDGDAFGSMCDTPIATALN